MFSRDPDGRRRPWAPNDVTKDSIRFRARVGLKSVRLHDLRHFSATPLLAAGVPLRTVSESSVTPTHQRPLVWTHTSFEESDLAAADVLGAELTNMKK